ncbi:hypothetical protein C7377_1738 [Balneicella halophila]|uniref:Uncharacterized protein n=1 Tax=Balneicella halophila TaxID=1537566 RepID=A0A7L4UP22_BALHA|nr:hypothetical protein C7377_1738 [Balneicella halophila]
MYALIVTHINFLRFSLLSNSLKSSSIIIKAISNVAFLVNQVVYFIVASLTLRKLS